jgi:hypothetical protein
MAVSQGLSFLQTTGVYTHPIAGLQESVVQWSPLLQFLVAPLHTPKSHLSFTVQRLPSSQSVPSGFPWQEDAVTQLPVAGSQVAGGVQTTAVPAVQTPLWHVSLPLQRLASAQLVPSALFA